MPDYNGLDLIKEAKEYNSEAYFIVITARGELEDKIKGFDLGADDYLPKPFWSNAAWAAPRSYKDQGIDLTKKEYKLLNYLVLNKNRVLDRLQLTEHIWGEFFEDDYDSNYIDVHVKNIRKKLSELDDTNWIKTVRGIGYKFEI